jgi:hypothetical protein
MQGVRGSNPLSYTPGQRPSPPSTAHESWCSGSKSAAIFLKGQSSVRYGGAAGQHRWRRRPVNPARRWRAGWARRRTGSAGTARSIAAVDLVWRWTLQAILGEALREVGNGLVVDGDQRDDGEGVGVPHWVLLAEEDRPIGLPTERALEQAGSGGFRDDLRLLVLIRLLGTPLRPSGRGLSASNRKFVRGHGLRLTLLGLPHSGESLAEVKPRRPAFRSGGPPAAAPDGRTPPAAALPAPQGPRPRMEPTRPRSG